MSDDDEEVMMAGETQDGDRARPKAGQDWPTMRPMSKADDELTRQA